MGELGLCSRREADRWITSSWVKVDGEVVDTLGVRVSPNARIEIDLAAREHQSGQVTILLHKPVGYVSGQAEDGYEPAIVLIRPENRWAADPLPIQFQQGHLRGLAPAGRLDIDSAGLLVLTQDGRVAKQLIGEDSLIEKEYLAGRRQPLRRRHEAPAVRSDARWREAEARTGVMAERTPAALRAAPGPQAPDPPHVRARGSFRDWAEARPAAATYRWEGYRWASGGSCGRTRISESGEIPLLASSTTLNFTR
jgi:16S rRNA U516 pseudouridylate synthase RsuA-like enzyme